VPPSPCVTSFTLLPVVGLMLPPPADWGTHAFAQVHTAKDKLSVFLRVYGTPVLVDAGESAVSARDGAGTRIVTLAPKVPLLSLCSRSWTSCWTGPASRRATSRTGWPRPTRPIPHFFELMPRLRPRDQDDHRAFPCSARARTSRRMDPRSTTHRISRPSRAVRPPSEWSARRIARTPAWRAVAARACARPSPRARLRAHP
jgi:hypothetical protein